MCFSAEASFTASAVLTISGIYAVSKTISSREKSFIMIAVIPLVFGFHQLLEGLIWVSLGEQTSYFYKHINIYAHLYLSIAIFVWLIWFPLSIALYDRKKRNVFLFFSLLSFCLSLWIFLNSTDSIGFVEVRSSNNALCYGNINTLSIIPRLVIYIALTTLTPLFSSFRKIRIFGILLFCSSLVAMFIFTETFISSWCFFAAVLSLYICYMAKQLKTKSPR